MNQYQEILRLAVYAGEIMLKNGAETYRVEDTICRISRSQGIQDVDSYVTPTGIMVNLASPVGDTETRIKRVKKRDINLSKISAVNEVSRKLVEKKISLAQGLNDLAAIDQGRPEYSPAIVFISAGLAAAAFTVLFGGSWPDFLPALTASIIVQLALYKLSIISDASFLQEFAGGILASLLGIFFIHFGFGQNLNKIILGAILTLVPGTALTNSIRDFISGDLLSGSIRGFEALLIAFAIAGGVGMVLSFYFQLSRAGVSWL